jgi:hypothetical protein
MCRALHGLGSGLPGHSGFLQYRIGPAPGIGPISSFHHVSLIRDAPNHPFTGV